MIVVEVMLAESTGAVENKTGQKACKPNKFHLMIKLTVVVRLAMVFIRRDLRFLL